MMQHHTGLRALAVFVLGSFIVTFGAPFSFADDGTSDLSTILRKLDKLEQENATLKSEISSIKHDTSGSAVGSSDALKDELAALKKEIADLRSQGRTGRGVSGDELENVKNEVLTLKKDLSAMRTSAPAATQTGTTVTMPALGEKPPIVASVPIELYGYIKADGIYNTAHIGDVGMSVPTGAANTTSAAGYNGTAEKQETRFTIRETRLGLNINGPAVMKNGKIVGKIETDFYGQPTGITDDTTTPIPRIRLAYVDLVFPKWDLLAGQDWDFFSPLNPSTLNFGILWRAGNLGDRHPQVVLTNKFADIYGGTLKTKVGLLDSKTIEQAARGLPAFAGFMSYERDVFGRPMYIGVGGLVGQAEAAVNSTTTTTYSTGNDSTRVDMWAATAAFKYKIHDKVAFMSEGFIGQDLAAFRGGSSVGVDGANTTGVNTVKGVRSAGGWMQLSVTPFEGIEVNTGTGIDKTFVDPLKGLTTSGSQLLIWNYNWSYFTNLKWSITKNLIWGIEYQYFLTKYKETTGGAANRIQSSLIYKF